MGVEEKPKPKKRNLSSCVQGNTDPNLAPIKRIVARRPREKVGKPPPTEDQAREIIVALKVGAPYDVACQAAGVKKAVGLEWLRRGKGEDSELGTTPELQRWAEDVEEAMSFATVRALKVIHNAATKTWTAAAWYLERTQPEKFANRGRGDASGKGAKNLNQDLGSLLSKGFSRRP